jgi:hypothetical protein
MLTGVQQAPARHQRPRRCDRSAKPTRRAGRLRAALLLPATRLGARRAGLRGFLAASNMLPRQFLAPQRHA